MADRLVNSGLRFDRTIRYNSVIIHFTEKIKVFLYSDSLDKLVSTFKIQIRADRPVNNCTILNLSLG